MGLREVEAAILRELREVTGNRKLRQKDIQEWSTGKVVQQTGEKLVRLPKLAVNVAYREP
jgi:AMMECR1 domain-containing protein